MRPLFFLASLILSACAAFAELTPLAISADRALWPREVTVNTPLEIPLIVNGKASGKMSLPAGRNFPLRSVQADTIGIEAGGSTITVPIVDTDLLSRAETISQQQAARAATLPTPAPTPTSAPLLPLTSTPAAQPAARNVVAGKISKKLVALDGRRVHKFDGSSILSKKYLAIYFSASWCGPCRKFTPDLVEWYNSNKSQSDLFEIVFVSNDQSEEQMKGYMVEDKMPWPALDYDAAKGRKMLNEFAGPSIPCLVIVDEKGKVLSHSCVDGQYVGPRKVLRDLENLIKQDS